jgi:hypothetical protein
MNDHREHPNSDNDLTKDQMAEQGIPIENSPSKVAQVNKELAEESGQKDASWKSASVPETENQGENNDFYNGMSQ